MALPFSFSLAFSVSLCSRSHISRSIPCASASLRSYHSIRGLRTVSFGRLNAEYVNPTAGINRVVAANSNLVLKYRLETKSVEDALALLRAWRVHEMPNVTFIDAFAGKPVDPCSLPSDYLTNTCFRERIPVTGCPSIAQRLQGHCNGTFRRWQRSRGLSIVQICKPVFLPYVSIAADLALCPALGHEGPALGLCTGKCIPLAYMGSAEEH